MTTLAIEQVDVAALEQARAEHTQYPGRFQYLPNGYDFTDMPVLEQPGERWSDMRDYTTLCPVCKGHGGWNLQVNAYGASKHFQAHCSQCNGYGWVTTEGAECIHEWHELTPVETRARGRRHLGMFDHWVECVHCGKLRNYDSSG